MAGNKKPFPVASGELAGGIRHAEFPMARRAVPSDELVTRGIAKTDDDGRMLYEVAISSESEIQRWFGIEVLSHASGAIDMTRINNGAAVLVDHGGDQVGKVMNGTVRVDEDKVQRGWVRFSRSSRGQEIEGDVADQTRENISVGYMVQDWDVELRETGKDENGKPIYTEVYRVTRWQPAEVSIVSVPADISVGVGRSVPGYPAARDEVAADAAGKGTRSMEPEKKASDILLEDNRSETEKQRDRDRAEIIRVCDTNGMGAMAPEFLEQGLTIEQVCREIIRHRGKARAAADVAPAGGDVMKGLRYSDRKRYSYARAILMAAGHGKLDGVEHEMHEALSEKYLQSGLTVRQNSVLVPIDLRTPDEYWQAIERRALDTKTGTKGPETVFEQPGELIELLRNRAAVVALGARTLTGLSGPIGFPKQTGAGVASWVGENPAADLADSDLALGLVMLQPKTIQSTTAYSRQLLVQSSVDIENLVRNDLALIHALAIDRAAIHGQSAAGQPVGIYLAPDVGMKDYSLGVPDYAKLVDQAALVADKNADEGSLGWITTPLMAAKLKQLPEHASGTMANWVWQGTFREGTMVGYPARGTNQVAKTMLASAEAGGVSHGIVFGNWNDLIIGMFGALEIVVDPYAKKKRALIEVTSFQLCDMILRHGESFAKSHGSTIV